MGDVRPLSDRKAVEKIRHIAKGEIAMLCTFPPGGLMQARPMGTCHIDDEGQIWFLSRKDSAKNRDIEANPRVELLYAVPGRSEYMAIEGIASISRDPAKIDDFWNPLAKTWFTAGKEDPSITLIRVTTTGGHYWDTKHNKMVQLGAIAIGALFGKTMDDGVEGALDV
ncbi:MAG TPA: pyridoxamine 5'-phosphate oxidase family protein [Polyangiaceae bacterium]